MVGTVVCDDCTACIVAGHIVGIASVGSVVEKNVDEPDAEGLLGFEVVAAVAWA